MLKVFGLKNCDSCRKARAWLLGTGIEHEFYDVRQTPVEDSTLATWLDALGSDRLINRRGTTWRALSDQQKALTQKGDIIALLTEAPALMKRPIFVKDGLITVGFTPAVQDQLIDRS